VKSPSYAPHAHKAENENPRAARPFGSGASMKSAIFNGATKIPEEGGKSSGKPAI
jgi:hypothetical protein